MRRLLLALVAVAALGAPLRAQVPSVPDTGLAAVLAAFDAADVGSGAAALRVTLARLPDSARAARGRALMYLAAAEWWLGAADSARTLMRSAVTADPFVRLDTLRFNPHLWVALLAARRETRVLGVRAPADVTLRPDSQVWVLDVAVGQPGTVRVHWRSPGQESVVATARVDSSATLRVALADSAGVRVRPGTSEVALELVDGTQALATRTVAVTMERLPVDTVAFQPEPSPKDFRVESRRGKVSAPSLLRGLLLAGAAAALPMAAANGSLPGSTVQRGAVVIGGGLALGSLLGALAGRTVEPIAENIQFNRDLRERWLSGNRAIAASNDYQRRFAPLRLKATVAP